MSINHILWGKIDKNVVEDRMINMNRWLKSFGLEDADWEKYKPIFYYKEL